LEKDKGIFMNLIELLQNKSDDIIANAQKALLRSKIDSYEKVGNEETRERLFKLYNLIFRSIQEKNLNPIVNYAETIGRERFKSGFNLWEVQTAFNVMEEAIWLKILNELPHEKLAEALGLVSTVIGAGKDNLARAYVSLASNTKPN
jgi:hypothetical protein